MVDEQLTNLVLQNLHDHEFLIEKQVVEKYREQLSKKISTKIKQKLNLINLLIFPEQLFLQLFQYRLVKVLIKLEYFHYDPKMMV